MIELLDVLAIDSQGSIAGEQTELRGDTAFSYRRKYVSVSVIKIGDFEA